MCRFCFNFVEGSIPSMSQSVQAVSVGDLKKCRKDTGSRGSFHRLEPPVVFFPGETCLTLCTGDA